MSRTRTTYVRVFPGYWRVYESPIQEYKSPSAATRPPKPEPPRAYVMREDQSHIAGYINDDGTIDHTPAYYRSRRINLAMLIVALIVLGLLAGFFGHRAAAAECRNIRVLDGDTLVADLSLGFDVVLHQQTIRIHNYDAWETSYRRQTIEYATDEMAKGALAKAALEKLLGSASKVTVQEVAGRDPYGRRLLEIYADGVSVGETLRKAGHERTTEKRVSTLKND